MNQEIIDKYLAKKSDMLQSECNCGWLGYMFLSDYLTTSFWGKCKKCGNKIYQVTCSKCQTGFCYPESKIIDNKWKCEYCKEENSIIGEKETEIFAKSELPPEVAKEEAGRGLPKWVVWLIQFICGVFAIYYIFGNFIK